MLGLFKSDNFVDDVLGDFKRKGEYWISSIEVAPHGIMELRLSGDRKGPDDSSLVLAKELPKQYASKSSQIAKALYEHYVPYAEAHDRGELGELEEPFPKISDWNQILTHVYPSHVLIEAIQGKPTVEVAYRTAWDEEHTLGARFQNGEFIELCGSV